jgi:hypothetical protein
MGRWVADAAVRGMNRHRLLDAAAEFARRRSAQQQWPAPCCRLARPTARLATAAHGVAAVLWEACCAGLGGPTPSSAATPSACLPLASLFPRPAQAPGTYLGLVEKLDYIKRLGVNAIELLPVGWRGGVRRHWGAAPLGCGATGAPSAALMGGIGAGNGLRRGSAALAADRGLVLDEPGTRES